MKVIILRGASGSGKSMLAERFSSLVTRSVIVSADQYFTDKKTGEYFFDRTRLGDAHAWCLRRYLDTLQMKDWTNILVVDNTNTRALEIAPYYQLAKAFNFPVGIVTILADPLLCWENNQHYTPLRVVHRQVRNAEKMEDIPSWWNHEIAIRDRHPACTDPDGEIVYEEGLIFDPSAYLESLK